MFGHIDIFESSVLTESDCFEKCFYCFALCRYLYYFQIATVVHEHNERRKGLKGGGGRLYYSLDYNFVAHRTCITLNYRN